MLNFLIEETVRRGLVHKFIGPDAADTLDILLEEALDAFERPPREAPGTLGNQTTDDELDAILEEALSRLGDDDAGGAAGGAARPVYPLSELLAENQHLAQLLVDNLPRDAQTALFSALRGDLRDAAGPGMRYGVRRGPRQQDELAFGIGYAAKTQMVRAMEAEVQFYFQARLNVAIENFFGQHLLQMRSLLRLVQPRSFGEARLLPRIVMDTILINTPAISHDPTVITIPRLQQMLALRTVPSHFDRRHGNLVPRAYYDQTELLRLTLVNTRPAFDGRDTILMREAMLGDDFRADPEGDPVRVHGLEFSRLVDRVGTMRARIDSVMPQNMPQQMATVQLCTTLHHTHDVMRAERPYFAGEFRTVREVRRERPPLLLCISFPIDVANTNGRTKSAFHATGGNELVVTATVTVLQRGFVASDLRVISTQKVDMNVALECLVGVDDTDYLSITSLCAHFLDVNTSPNYIFFKTTSVLDIPLQDYDAFQAGTVDQDPVLYLKRSVYTDFEALWTVAVPLTPVERRAGPGLGFNYLVQCYRSRLNLPSVNSRNDEAMELSEPRGRVLPENLCNDNQIADEEIRMILQMLSGTSESSLFTVSVYGPINLSHGFGVKLMVKTLI